MKLTLVFLALAFAWCDASKIACQSYNESEKLLVQTCDSYNFKLQRMCTNSASDVDPSDIRRLKIQKCDPSVIREASENFEHIEHLDVSDAVLSSLGDVDKPFADLTELNASYNSLLHVPKQIVNKCPDLKVLDLSYNPITRINHGDFEQSQQIKTIDLSHCMLDSINGEAFGNLSDLQVLRLNKNRLSSIPLLHFLNHPVELDLQENQLRTFNCTTIAAMSPATVYLSWGNVESFLGDQGCGARQFRVKQSEYGTANEGVSSATGDWELFCNDLSFRNLQHFVAGAMGFENIRDILPLIGSRVTKLDLSDNNIGDFNQTILKRFRSLQELRLRNTQLTAFDVDALDQNTQNSLRHLDISNNFLTEIKNSHLLQNFNLIDFDAAGNKIQNASEVIQNLPVYMQRLNMGHSNNVGEINSNMFDRLPYLTRLDLSDTHLSFVDFSVFRALSMLINLNISGNDLSQVNMASLAQLNQLQEFRAANCQISNVPDMIQHLGPFVEKVDLSGNPATKFDPRSFERLNNLKELSLSGMGLQEIDSTLFEHLPSLTHLDISGNKLKDLDVGRFPNTLQQLRLHANDLQRIDNLDRQHFPVLRVLTISQNQLECDYVDQLRAEFNDNIILVKDSKFDAFQQQNGTCHNNLIFILLCIFGALLILIILICVCFLCRKRLCRKDH